MSDGESSESTFSIPTKRQTIANPKQSMDESNTCMQSIASELECLPASQIPPLDRCYNGEKETLPSVNQHLVQKFNFKMVPTTTNHSTCDEEYVMSSIEDEMSSQPSQSTAHKFPCQW